MVRVRMVEAEQSHVLLSGLLLEFLYLERLDEKAAAALFLVRVLGPPHVDDDFDTAAVDTDQRTGTLLRVRLFGVVVDLPQVPCAYLERKLTAPRTSRRGPCRPRRKGWRRPYPTLSPLRPRAPSRPPRRQRGR